MESREERVTDRKSICELVAEEPLVKEIVKKSKEKVEYGVSYYRVDDKLKLIRGPIKGTIGAVTTYIIPEKDSGSVHTHPTEHVPTLTTDDLVSKLDVGAKWFCVVADTKIKCADFKDYERVKREFQPLIKDYKEAADRLDKFEEIVKEEEKKRGREIIGRELTDIYEKLEDQFMETDKKIQEKLKQADREGKVSICNVVVK